MIDSIDNLVLIGQELFCFMHLRTAMLIFFKVELKKLKTVGVDSLKKQQYATVF